MIKVNQSPYYLAKLWITPAMEEFVQKANLNCEYEVGLIECGYYRKEGGGAWCGMIGNTGEPKPEITRMFDERDQVLIMKFKLDNIDNLANLRTKLILTPGARNTYDPIKIKKITTKVERDYELYYWKRPGFNGIFKAAKAMMPNLTELDLAKFNSDGFNHELIAINRDPIYLGDLLFSETKTEIINDQLLFYEVNVTILSDDLKVNTDVLIEALTL